MAWIGWQVGTSGPTVQKAKRKLKQKFSYASKLDDSEYYGQDLCDVVAEYQRRKNATNNLGLRIDGVLDWATQLALGVIDPNPPAQAPKKGVILSVQGSGVDMWTGPPADTARGVADLFYWQPVGNYPAAFFPMKPSYDQGIEELVLQCRKHAGKPKVLAGYSQGAIVTSRVLKHEILNPSGRLHDLRDEFVGGLTWGNPDRELGVANGNVAAGWVVPQGRGASDDRLENTPSWWLDFAHGANSSWGRDLYTDTPADKTGDDVTTIWHLIENATFSSLAGLMERLLEVVQKPVVEVVPLFRAVLYAGMFFAAGTGPHINYDVTPAIAHVRALGKSL
jgi:hypothetical protein